MPTSRITRTLPATPDDVWRVAGDPNHLYRWWPRVTRVEGVTGRGFTQVLTSKRGREVRADFTVVRNERPRLRTWSLDISGTPFERHFVSSETEVRLEPDGPGTRVAIELRQKMRGSSRFGGFMIRRAGNKLLREAMDTLEARLP